MMTPEQRVTKIRSIIRNVEKAMDNPYCDQLRILRIAFLEITQVVGAQNSGRRVAKKVSLTSEDVA